MFAKLFVIAAALLCITPAQTGQLDKRTILMRVTVHDATNEPVSGVVVALQSVNNQRLYALTNELGIAAVSIDLPNEACSVAALLSPRAEGITGDRAAMARAYAQAIQTSHFKRMYKIAVPAESTSIEFTIKGEACIRVVLHARKSDPRNVIDVVSPQAARQAPALPSSDVTMHGIKKGATALFGISVIGESPYRIMEVTASQTLTDVELFDVESLEEPNAVTVDLRVMGGSALQTLPDIVVPAVSLIGLDSERCYCGIIQHGDEGRVVTTKTSQFKVVPGRYAVVPGILGADPGPTAVYGFIKQNQRTPPGVPEVVVDSTGSNTLNIDGIPARDASLKLPPYP